MTTSKKAFDLVKAYTGKTVIVRDIKTDDKVVLGLVQLIPGVPLIGLYLKNGIPKNWSSTPVTFITHGKNGQGKLVDGDLLVVTTAGGYVVSPWVSDGVIPEDTIFKEDVYCSITIPTSTRVNVAISDNGDMSSTVISTSIKE